MKKRSDRQKKKSSHCLNWFVPRYLSPPVLRPMEPQNKWTTSGAQPCRPSLWHSSEWKEAGDGLTRRHEWVYKKRKFVLKSDWVELIQSLLIYWFDYLFYSIYMATFLAMWITTDKHAIQNKS